MYMIFHFFIPKAKKCWKNSPNLKKINKFLLHCLHSFEVTDVVLESGWDSGGKKERKLRGEKEKERKKKTVERIDMG